MGGLVEIAGAALARSEAQVEAYAQNIANITTHGYKSVRPFSGMISTETAEIESTSAISSDRDWSDGKAIVTGDAMDIAVSGSGFLVVRTGDNRAYMRSGHFVRDADGRLATATGAILQGDRGDVVLEGAGDPVIGADGTIAGGAGGDQRLTIVEAAQKSALQPMGDGLYTASADAMHEISSGVVSQGAQEASNVSDATEMTSIMASLRSAETAQRVVQIYDQLMTQAANVYGQRGG